MGRIISSLLLLGTLICFCVLGTAYTETAASQMKDALEQSLSAVHEGNWKAAMNRSEKAAALWEDCCKKLSLYTPHSKLDSISQNLASLTALASCRVKEQFYTEAARCKSQISGLEKTEFPTVDNIL